MGNMPEATMVKQMWPGNTQPQTSQPEFSISDEGISLRCSTKGASIAYILSDTIIQPDLNSGWQLYSKPLEIKKTKYLYAMSNRIGYADSKAIEIHLLKKNGRIKIESYTKAKE